MSAARSSCRAGTRRPAPGRAPSGRPRASRPWPRVWAARPRSRGRPSPEAPPEIAATVERPAYEAAVRRAVDYILAGDVFQVNLSQRFTAGLPAGMTPFDLYRRLRTLNPAPFAAYLALGDAAVVSASPERFLRAATSGWVETRPDQGHPAPRAPRPSADDELAAELLASEKDRAENVMIVDLLRNDLSRVCTRRQRRGAEAVRAGALRHRHPPGLDA